MTSGTDDEFLWLEEIDALQVNAWIDPPVLITTSTRDDRVHPGHARKMAARLLAHGYDVTYYENREGGHAGAADHEQEAFVTALATEFLWRRLAGGTDAGRLA